MITLLLLTLLSILVAVFAFTVKVEEKVARNAKDDLKMAFAARGGLAWVRGYLRADRADPDGQRLDSVREDWATFEPGLTLGDVQLEVVVADCERKLNVNLLAREDHREFASAVLRRLLERLYPDDAEIDPTEVAERIADYVDVDEDGDYEDGAWNGTVISPAELLAVPGIPAAVWLGTTEESFDPEDPEAELVPGLLTFLTAWGAETLNLNTMDRDLFWAMLPDEDATGKTIDRDEVLDQIDLFRTGGTEEDPAPEGEDGDELPGADFETVDALATQIQGLSNIFPKSVKAGSASAGESAPPLPKELLTVNSLDFEVTIYASRAGLARRFQAILRRGEEEFNVLMWRELNQ
jgi:type II secretory pathway component PulK